MDQPKKNTSKLKVKCLGLLGINCHDNNLNHTINTLQNQEIVDAQLELLKYKMGKYLHNCQKGKLSFKEIVQRYWLRVLTLFIAALIFNAGIQIFLKPAETIPSGVTGIPTLIQYIVPTTEAYFALIYLACNIPLFVIFARKIKLSFLALTFTFMLFQILTNLIFTHPVVAEWFKDKIVLTEKYLPYTNWSNLINTVIGASFIGLGIALAWKAGGSTGGTDIIGYYFSTKAKKSIGQVLSILGFITAMIFLIIFAFIKPNYLKEEPLSIKQVMNLSEIDYAQLHDYKGVNQTLAEVTKRHEIITKNYYESKIYFGMREITTFLYIIVVNLVVNLLYPKYKKVEMTIVSSNPEMVIAYFKLINFWHSYRIEKYISGYTNQEGSKITTVLLALETNNIIDDLKKIDPKVWISVTKVLQISGSFTTDYVEQ